jgi:hypothetical protein
MNGERIGLTHGCRAFQLKQCPAHPNRMRRLGILVRPGVRMILRVRVSISLLRLYFHPTFIFDECLSKTPISPLSYL